MRQLPYFHGTIGAVLAAVLAGLGGIVWRGKASMPSHDNRFDSMLPPIVTDASCSVTIPTHAKILDGAVFSAEAERLSQNTRGGNLQTSLQKKRKDFASFEMGTDSTTSDTITNSRMIASAWNDDRDMAMRHILLGPFGNEYRENFR